MFYVVACELLSILYHTWYVFLCAFTCADILNQFELSMST